MPKNSSKLDNMRHSAAHLLAAAVEELYPGSQFAIGPTIEDGFYYDILFPTSISEDDLTAIEQKMKHLRKRNLPIKSLKLKRAEALKKEKDQPFKLELIKDLPGKQLSYTQLGNFVDLCRGGHVTSTREIGPFKLTKLAGAYWRGDEKNPQLTRIYGVAFESQPELDKHLAHLEEIKKRDHRKLGIDLDLFMHSDLVGSGLPLLTERGTMIVNTMQKLVKDLQEPQGYQEVRTPHLTRLELYKVSGHAEKFPDLFKVATKEKEPLAIKPVNCPHHVQLYARRTRSYRDLPIRYAEFSTLYRDELSGTLGGLTRVRSLTQDDAHVFCREDQIEEEFDQIFGLVKKVMGVYGLDYRFVFATHDPKNFKAYLGDHMIWKKAEATLLKILKKHKLKFETAVGEAAIYGPKLDLLATDSLGREWQLSTIQLDFNQPTRFGLTYVDEKGKEQTPVMIHRALHGTFERFLGLLIEHTAGAFPFWLAPEQVRVIAVSDKFAKYAAAVEKELRTAGLRVNTDLSGNTMGKKIREAELMKVPFAAVVGEKEQKSKLIAVRQYGKGDLGTMKVLEWISKLLKLNQPSG